jgi:hypothetical protein
MTRWHRLLSLMGKEFIQIRRDRRTLGMMLIIPFVWLLIFGYAATFDVRHIRTGIVGATENPMVQMVTALSDLLTISTWPTGVPHPRRSRGGHTYRSDIVRHRSTANRWHPGCSHRRRIKPIHIADCGTAVADNRSGLRHAAGSHHAGAVRDRHSV